MLMMTVNILRAQDKFLDILNEELKREMKELQKQENPPYFISYRVDDEYTVRLASSFGVITQSDENRTRTLTVMVRVGDYTLDNTHESKRHLG